nr:13E12 repeat family protein [Acidimicrobiales bacterium]
MAPASVGEVEITFGQTMAEFDPAVLSATDATALMGSFTRIKRMAEAGEALCARRAAATSVVRRHGDHSGSTWAGRRMGTSPTRAGGLLEMAGHLEQLPATREALLAGEISTDQACEVARTASLVPEAEADLLKLAPRESLGELKRRGRRLRAAAPGAEERFARVRERRYLRAWTDDEGAGRGAWSLPPEDQAMLLAALAPLRERIFRDARTAGRREPAEAYDADALVALARDAMAVADSAGADVRPGPLPASAPQRVRSSERDNGARRGGAHDGGAGRGTVDDGGGARSSRGDGRIGRSGRAAKIIVRVDRDALLRGYPVGGEVCEVTGVGPVPVAAVQRWIGEDAFLAAVVTDGVDIRSVVHLGRQATALQRTALEWLAPECCVVGCNASARLEIDHEQDWARTRHTTLDELDHLCAHHHRLKTRHGHRLEPGRGRRRLLPPSGSDRIISGPSDTGAAPPRRRPVPPQEPGPCAACAVSATPRVTLRIRSTRRIPVGRVVAPGGARSTPRVAAPDISRPAPAHTAALAGRARPPPE